MSTVVTSSIEHLRLQASGYTLRFVQSQADLERVQRLRFEVFNLDVKEGLASAYQTGRDADAWDAVCTHLMVEHDATQQLVGTYRMQTGWTAKDALGYYAAQAFDMTVFAAERGQMLELGRACIAQKHRHFSVLVLLWRGIAAFAQEHGARYLVGCSSLTSQSPQDAHDAYNAMQVHLAPQTFRTLPHPSKACAPVDRVQCAHFKLPKLLSTYLSLGAWVCGPAALDAEFKTLDFLTLLDLHAPQMKWQRQRFGF